MVTKKRVCDICGREMKWHANFFRFKVKSSSFETYANSDDWNPDVRHFDLCQDCLNEIARNVNKKEDPYGFNNTKSVKVKGNIINYICDKCKEHNCRVDLNICPNGALTITVYGDFRKDSMTVGAYCGEETIKTYVNDSIRRTCDD